MPTVEGTTTGAVMANSTNSAAVKPPSTPAATTDAAQVVVISPNNTVGISASNTHIGEIGTALATPSSTFTRPANVTAYAAGQLVANNTVAASVTPLSWAAARVAAGSFTLRRARITKSSTGVAAASFRLHLYDTSPTLTNGDGAAWLTTLSGYLGSVDLDMSGANGRVFSDAAGVIGAPNVGVEVDVKLAAGQTVYGLLEARAAYTPVASESFTAILELIQN